MDSRYALVLAGGSGTRFWPLSRHVRPKQLLNLFGDGTLLERTIDRLSGLMPRENILILTNADQIAGVREVLSEFPPENVIAEPAKRDTAPAVALGVAWVAARDPNGVMAVLPSDQLIDDIPAYHQVMGDAMKVAGAGEGIVTIGIKPTWPCPSYGYIEKGEREVIEGCGADSPVYNVARFCEKPSTEQAQEYIDTGRFNWNAGMFVWSVPTVRAELEKHCPELSAFVDRGAAAEDLETLVADEFASLPRISIDYALMEHARRIYNIEATFSWDDVGSWLSVANYLPSDEQGNRHRGSVTALDASENVVFSADDTKVALVGVDNLVVIRTGDALLICPRAQADRIKDLVDMLEPELL